MPISGRSQMGTDDANPSRSRTTPGPYIELPCRPAGHVIKGAAQCPTCFSVWQLGCKIIFSCPFSGQSSYALSVRPVYRQTKPIKPLNLVYTCTDTR